MKSWERCGIFYGIFRCIEAVIMLLEYSDVYGNVVKLRVKVRTSSSADTSASPAC